MKRNATTKELRDTVKTLERKLAEALADAKNLREQRDAIERNRDMFRDKYGRMAAHMMAIDEVLRQEPFGITYLVQARMTAEIALGIHEARTAIRRERGKGDGKP